MHTPAVGLLLSCLTVALAAPTAAQAPPAAAQTPPAAADANAPAPLIMIHREEVKPGRAAAHATNETAWAGAFAKAGVPVHWLGMTTVVGPTEAWFLEAHDSLASVERSEQAVDDNAALRAESDGFAASEGDLLSRSSTVLARYRPGLSYQPGVNLRDMRFMSVDLVRVKPGHIADFAEVWRAVVAAHTKANLTEHWAVYQVDSGMADGTFLFFYPHTSLAEVDAAGPAHAADAFRDAMGERGRLNMLQTEQSAIEMSMRFYFKLNPSMSTLPATWSAADPFWARPAPVVAQAGRSERKR